MPKAYEDMVNKMKGKKGVKNPFAMAHAIMQKQGKEAPKAKMAPAKGKKGK